MALGDTMERFVKLWSRRFNYIGYAACGLMLCLSIIDIVGGKLFSRPLPGAFDIISLVAVLVAAFPIASTELAGGHVRLDMGLTFLPKRVVKFCKFSANFLCICLFMLLIYSLIKFGIRMFITHEATMTIQIPLFPFIFALVIACIPAVLVFLLELKKSDAMEDLKEGDRL